MSEKNPYAPPKSVVRDLPVRPARWTRAAWLHLGVFFGMLLTVYAGRDLFARALTPASVIEGALLSVALLYFSCRSLLTLSDRAPPWWFDVLYYATVAVFVFGAVTLDLTLLALGAMPTLVINGVAGMLAVVVERRHGVRVYVSGRRYLFADRRE